MKAEDVESYINGEMQGDSQKHFESELELDLELRDLVKSTRQLLYQLNQKGFYQRISLAKPTMVSGWKKYKYLTFGSVMFVLFVAIYMIYFQSKGGPGYNSNPDPTETFNSESAVVPDTFPNIQNPESKTDSMVSKPYPKIQVPAQSIPIAESNSQMKWETNRQLAMDVYSTPKQIEVLRGTEINSIVDSAKLALNNEEFNKALKLLERSNMAGQNIDYLKAIIYFNLGNYEASRQYLKKLEFKDKDQTEELEWYLMLNDLACGSKCFDDFNVRITAILSQPNHSFHKKAKYLFGKINSEQAK